MTLEDLLQAKTQKEQEIASLKQKLQHMKFTVPEMTDEEKDDLEEQRLRAGAEAYMDYDPNTAYSWIQQAENLKATKASRAENKKARVAGYLNEVAAEFQNIDPSDTEGWTEARNRWISVEPMLSDYIPSTASQNNWDRIQSQGGNKSVVAPKGGFAEKKYIDDQVMKYTYLASAARASGNTAKADLYTKKAMELQDASSEGVDNIDVSTVLQKYNADIEKLKTQVTKDQTPSTVELFSKISNDIGEGAVLEDVKKEIKTILSDTKSGKSSQYQDSDETLRTQAGNMKSQADDLVLTKRKINSAIALVTREIKGGAARIAAKDLQGDVLAESEFSGYKNNDPIVQAFGNLANRLAGVTFITTEDAMNLINALVDVYNKASTDYNTALKGNKYRNTSVGPISPISSKKDIKPTITEAGGVKIEGWK